MILCLDCGNTRLKWGLRDNDEWLASGALAHAEITRLAGLLPAGCTPRIAIGCNVAGAALAGQIEAALGLTVNWITASDRQCGVMSGYDNPKNLGADRWAALIGAKALHRGAALVVLAGTATTIDVLDASGHFEGGLILPGVSMMVKALANNTARLPLALGEYRQIPRNTQDAITSGAIQATLGAIERMFATLSSSKDAACLLAGGAADILQAHLAVPNRRIDHLVLEGLACIAAAQLTDPA